MRTPLTLSLYIARHFFQVIMATLGGLMVIVLLFDVAELVRRMAVHSQNHFGVVFEMAMLKAPSMAARILPFAVMIGGMAALTRLSRSSELVAARAAGVSVWQFLRPAWILALVIGALYVGVLNPVSAAMLERFELLEARYISGRPSLLAISSSGLWLRDFEETDVEGRERIFHALRLSQQDMKLHQVMVFRFGAQSTFLGRVDAKSAQLNPGHWLLEDVILSRPGKPPEHRGRYRLNTNLTMEQIQDSFASPETLSFWELPRFIDILEEAGFSAVRHRLYWQVTLSSPVLLMGMIFLSAAFSLRMPRRGGVTGLIVAGVGCSFLIYFLTDLVHAFGLSGSLPLVLAAWAPAAATLLAGIWLMIHQEHG